MSVITGKLWAAIDPGKAGGIVEVNDNGYVVAQHKMPVVDGDYDLGSMLEIVRGWAGEGIHVAIEHCHAFPGIGARSNFEVGRGFGLWLGMLAACRVPHTVVSAAKWHGVMCGGISVAKGQKKPAKVKARIAAERLWPGVFRPTQDGLIDAALIAEWLRREIH